MRQARYLDVEQGGTHIFFNLGFAKPRKLCEILNETNVPGPAPTHRPESRWLELRRGKGAACLGVALAQPRRVPPRASFQQLDRVLRAR